MDEIRDKDWYDSRIAYLRTFMTEERFDTFCRVLDHRTDYINVCVENTYHSQNASALVRTCEAFGIQTLHTVETLCHFNPHENIVRGTDKWVNIIPYKSTGELINHLKGSGYRIVATTPHGDECSPETFDVEAGPFALFFGTEREGISDEVIFAADEFLTIPMCGMVESLNVSASASILIYMLSQRLRQGSIDWRLDELRRTELLFEWLMGSVKDSQNILKRFK